MGTVLQIVSIVQKERELELLHKSHNTQEDIKESIEEQTEQKEREIALRIEALRIQAELTKKQEEEVRRWGREGKKE